MNFSVKTPRRWGRGIPKAPGNWRAPGRCERAVNPPREPQRPGVPRIFLGQCSERGIALVITLLMLSAITFLAVAFLAMSRRDRAAVTSTMDVDSARNMSDAAMNRAQAEIVAQMEARGDALSYDYMVSRNYINPFGFTNKNTNIVNVNYDYYGPNSNAFNMSQNPAAWAQNIANLYYDPRPPVFIVTNSAFPNNSDFRFWVDINRNGRFVEIAVEDDGPGIPEARREEAFRPFHRLDEGRNLQTGGVGLGLAIARDAARAHGGELALEDSEAGGLRAVVRLPV